MVVRIGSPACEAKKRPDLRRWRSLELISKLDAAIAPVPIFSMKVRPIATGKGRVHQNGRSGYDVTRPEGRSDP
jgi:hypothetical protein